MSALVPPPQLSAYDKHVTEPASDGTRGQHQHVFILNDDDGQPHLKLKLISDSPSNSLPTYKGNALPIYGSVELNLKKPTGISMITVKLNGIIFNSEIDYRPFLELEDTLVSEKTELEGTHTWPFTFQIPSTLTFDEKQTKALNIELEAGTAYPLPPSMSSTSFGTMVDYNISVDVKRSSFFGRPLNISTLIGYAPTNLSSGAYGISDGWSNFESTVKGTVSGDKKVDATCELSIPTPLAYKRGSTLPLRLTLTSSTPSTLSTLVHPDIFTCELTLHHKVRPGINSYGSALAWRKEQAIPRVVWKAITESTFEDTVDPDTVSTPASTSTSSASLEGELTIPIGTQPSFTFGAVGAYYTIDLKPLKARGFVPTSDDLLYTIPVSILVE